MTDGPGAPPPRLGRRRGGGLWRRRRRRTGRRQHTEQDHTPSRALEHPGTIPQVRHAPRVFESARLRGGATLATVGEMSRLARARLVCSAAAALLAGALGAGCGSSSPVDKNFGTDLGADFRAPITDAGSDGDTNVTPEASVDGTGTGGTTGTGGSGSGAPAPRAAVGRRAPAVQPETPGRPAQGHEGHGHQPQFVRKKIVEEPMQVVCATCQLSFDAPEGATGLVCPICRGPLRPQAAAGSEGDGAARRRRMERRRSRRSDCHPERASRLGAGRGPWPAQTVMRPSARFTCWPAASRTRIYQGKATDDALDWLRADKPTRFRVELRLPNPSTAT